MRALVVSGWSGVLFVAAWASPAQGDVLVDCRDLRAQGRTAEALAAVEAAAAKSPADATLAIERAEILAAAGRPADAVKALDAALAKAPKDARLLCAKARAYLFVADLAASERADAAAVKDAASQVEELLAPVLAADKKSVPARLLLLQAFPYVDGRDTSRASQLVVELLAEAPGDAGVQHAAGVLHLKGAERNGFDAAAALRAAEKHFRAALAADPNHGEAALNLARTLGRRGLRRSEGAALFEKAAELSPGTEAALLALGNWAPSAADRAAAFRRLHRKRPQDLYVLLHYASALIAFEEHREARTRLDEARALARDEPLVAIFEGDLLLWQKQPDAAVAKWLEAVELARARGRLRGYDEVGWRSIASNALSVEQREKLWDAMWKAFPKVTDAPWNAGLWLLNQGEDARRSVAWLFRARDVTPQDPTLATSILNEIGLAYATLDAPDRAETAYKNALGTAEKLGRADPEVDDGYRNAVTNLVKLLLAAKRYPDLLALCEEHLKKHPDYETIRKLAAPPSK